MAKNVQINDKGVIKIITEEGKELWGQIKSMQGNALLYKNIGAPSEFNAAHNFSEENTLVAYPDGTGASLVLSNTNKAIAQDLRGKYQPKPLPERTALPPNPVFAAATKDAAPSSPAAPPKATNYDVIPPLPVVPSPTPVSMGGRPITPTRAVTPPSSLPSQYVGLPPLRTSSSASDASGDKSGAGTPTLTPSTAAAPVVASSVALSPTSATVQSSAPKSLTPAELEGRAKATGMTATPVVPPAPTSLSSAAITHGLGGAGPSAATGASDTTPLSSAAPPSVPASISSTPSASAAPGSSTAPAPAQASSPSSSASASSGPMTASSSASATTFLSTEPAVSLHTSSSRPSASGSPGAAPSATPPSATAAPLSGAGVLKPFIGGSENSIVDAVKYCVELAVKNNLVEVGPAYKDASGEDIKEVVTSKIDPVDRNILHLHIPISMKNKGSIFDDAKAEDYADVKVTSQSVSLENPAHFNTVVFAAMVAAACQLCRQGVYPLVLDLNPQKLGYNDAEYDEFIQNVITPIIKKVSRHLKVPDAGGLKIGQGISFNKIQTAPAPLAASAQAASGASSSTPATSSAAAPSASGTSVPTSSGAVPPSSAASAQAASGAAPSTPAKSSLAAPAASGTSVPTSSGAVPSSPAASAQAASGAAPSTPPGSATSSRAVPRVPGFIEELDDSSKLSSASTSTLASGRTSSSSSSSSASGSTDASPPRQQSPGRKGSV